MAKHLPILFVGLFLTPVLAAAADAQTYAGIFKQAKPATALATRTRSGAMGTAFCIDSHGLLVASSQHAWNDRPGEEIRLIFNSGTPDQQILFARIVRVDRNLGIALLQAENASPWPALELGSDAQFNKFEDVLDLSFPAVTDSDNYPAIVAHIEKRFSFQLDETKFPDVRVYESYSPENLGHPLIDRTGKVIGVVVGVAGRGAKYMAIPAKRIRQLLEIPIIYLDAPLLTPSNRHDSLPFSVSPVMLGCDATDLHVELVLNSKSEAMRRFRMQKIKNGFQVNVVPFPIDKDGYNLRMAVVYPNGSVQGKAKDQNVQLGNKNFPLSQIQSISFKPKPAVTLKDGTAAGGSIKFDSLKLKLGDQTVDLNLRGALSVCDTVPPESYFLQCTVILSDGDREITRLDQNDYFNGTPPVTMQCLHLGKFNKPAPAMAPTTYFHAISDQEFIGKGKDVLFSANELSFEPSDIAIALKAPQWHLVFVPPAGEKLSVGEYLNAVDHPGSGRLPGISIGAYGNGSSEVKAQFVIWELKVDNGIPQCVAIDFICRNNHTGPPLYGSIRYHSTFQ